MSGLIWAGIGKGISDAGTSVGNAMMRRMERDEAAEQRRIEKEEDREFRRQQDALYRKPADASGSGSSGGGGGGGFSLDDIAEGGKAEAMIAGEMGIDVPTLRALRKARQTGDRSAFEQPEEDPNVGPVRYSLPEGFEKYLSAKLQTMSRVEATHVHGKNYKEVAEGGQTAFETDIGRGILGGAIDPTKGAQATATMKGTAPFGGDSNVTRNVITGDTKTTPVGESAIFENMNPKDLKGASEERLTSAMNSLNQTLSQLEENQPSASDKEATRLWNERRNAALELRDEVVAALRSRIKTPPAPAPAPRVTFTPSNAGAGRGNINPPMAQPEGQGLIGNAAAAGGQNVKLGGKPSWQSQESYNDQVRILMQEFETANAKAQKGDSRAREDVAALTRELRRLGVDPGAQGGDNQAGAKRPPLDAFRQR